jgi:predicted PurR-regulated permease PerM
MPPHMKPVQSTADRQPLEMPRTGEAAAARSMSTRAAIMLFFTLGLLFYVGWVLRHALLLIYFSIMVAVLLTPFVDRVAGIRMGRWRVGRGMGILLLALVCAGALALFFLFALPPIRRDAMQMFHDLPRIFSNLVHKLGNLPYVNKINPETLTRWAEHLVGGAFGFFTGVASGVAAFATMVILAAYFILEGEEALSWGLSLLPALQQPRLERALRRGAARMRRWLAGQGLLMLIHGVSSTIVFGLLGLHYFYLLGAFAGVINIVPVLGPVITVLVAAAVAATQSPGKVIGAVIFFLAYHNIENAFLTPRIMRAGTHLPAVSVLIALLIGGELAGIVGILAAVPTAALLSDIIKEYFVHPALTATPAAVSSLPE